VRNYIPPPRLHFRSGAASMRYYIIYIHCSSVIITILLYWVCVHRVIYYIHMRVCVRVHQQQSRVVFRVWIRRVWIENVTILPENMTGNEALSEHDWCYCPAAAFARVRKTRRPCCRDMAVKSCLYVYIYTPISTRV